MLGHNMAYIKPNESWLVQCILVDLKAPEEEKGLQKLLIFVGYVDCITLHIVLHCIHIILHCITYHITTNAVLCIVHSIKRCLFTPGISYSKSLEKKLIQIYLIKFMFLFSFFRCQLSASFCHFHPAQLIQNCHSLQRILWFLQCKQLLMVFWRCIIIQAFPFVYSSFICLLHKACYFNFPLLFSGMIIPLLLVLLTKLTFSVPIEFSW